MNTMSTELVTPKELKENNLRALKIRKKEYKLSLTKYFELTGYVFITLLYFKNISFIRFATRMILHKIVANPFPTHHEVQFEQNVKKQLTKSLFYTILVINMIYLIIDLIVGIPTDNPDSDFFNGSLTLQIIGDTKPTSRFSYLYYNCIIIGSQYITIYLSSVLNTDDEIDQHNETLEGSTYTLNEVEGDGFSGRTTVATVRPKEIFNEITGYEMSTESTEHYNDYMGTRLNIHTML